MPLKILHTSDWHLGKKLFRESRLEEQKLFLDWLYLEIKREEIDALLVAGDVFDSPTPPHEAQKLYYNFLEQLSETTACKTFIIAGNHDSGKLLEAPLAFLAKNNIQVCGTLGNSIEEFKSKALFHLKKESDECDLLLFPFFRAHELLKINFEKPSNGELPDFLTCLQKVILSVKSEMKAPNSILLFHHQVGSFSSSPSEHSVTISGLDSIPTKVFTEHFSYLALGHIHRPQSLSTTALAHYSGAPLPFRFSEVGEKRIQLIEINGTSLTAQKKVVPDFRELKSIKLKEEELTQATVEEYGRQLIKTSSHLPPFIEIEVEIRSPRPGIADKIREWLSPFAISPLTISVIKKENEVKEDKPKVEELELSDQDLFKNFLRSKFSAITKEEEANYIALFNELSEEILKNELAAE